MRAANGLFITDHAILRRLERSGARVTQEQKITKIVMLGDEVEPKDRLIKLLTNKCKEAKYYLYGGMIAVVIDNRVVTVYQYDDEDWRMI